MSWTYLLIDLGSISIPLAFSFHKKLRFHKQWSAAIPAIIVVALAFIIHDLIWTDLGVWGFTPEYLTGYYFFNLPIEEVLFFICIPYACLFTYHCLGVLWPDKINLLEGKIVLWVLVAALLVVGVIYIDNLYTGPIFIALAVMLLITHFTFKAFKLGRFFVFYAIILVPFLIVNGMLTGTGLETQVVWYNEAEIIGPRILTIPIEDTFYGMLMILGNTIIFEFIRIRNARIS